MKTRDRVFVRDGGICKMCGFDTGRVVAAWKFLKARRGIWLREFCAGLRKKGYRANSQTLGHVWEADHVLPRSLGGSNELENYRTLCIPCHRAETKRLARYRKMRRRLKMQFFPERFVLDD